MERDSEDLIGGLALFIGVAIQEKGVIGSYFFVSSMLSKHEVDYS